MFSDLAQLDQRAPQALKHLIGIYQAERDWEKAIENASRYEAASGEPMGKAGAYAIQGLAAAHVQRISGSHSGIMGLPLYETALLLRTAGVAV